MATFEGINERIIETPEGEVTVLERARDAKTTPAIRTLVVLHGAKESAESVRELLVSLPSDLRVVALQLTDEDAAALVRSTIEAVPVGAPHVLGWGTDATKLAQAYAEEYPTLSFSGIDEAKLDDATRRTILRTIEYIGTPANPAPPTEVIVLRSAD